MKIYRYRPISQFLYKELFYQEIYLASYSELNDPLDMVPYIDFRATDLAEACAITELVCKRISLYTIGRIVKGDRSVLGVHENGLAMQSFISESRDSLAEEVLNEMSNRDAQVVIDTEQLMHVFEAILLRKPGDFPFLRHLNTVKQSIEASVSVFFNNSHLACFAEEANNFMMWSHYADKHQGICLEFEIPRRTEVGCELTLEIRGAAKKRQQGEPNQFVADVYQYGESVRRVQYSNSIEPVRYFDYMPLFANEGNVDLHELSKSWWHPFANKLKQVFLNKHTRWESEKEWRMVDVTFKKTEIPEQRIRHYDINSLTGVIFGCRTSDKVKERISRIVRRESNETVFYEAQLRNLGRIEIVKTERYPSEDEGY